jgi:ubiquinone/menaquinone biosynthesis C-methylase UbiE
MDTAEEALDYDAMDHGAVNAAFCDDLLSYSSRLPRATGRALLGPRVLDVGTGTALIPVELCRRQSSDGDNFHVVAIDLSKHMLARAVENVRGAGFQDRIMLETVDAKRLPYPSESFSTVVSNSIVHHIPDPKSVLAEMARVTEKGGVVFVRDLVRPEHEADVDRLVSLYAAVPPGELPGGPSNRKRYERQRDLFRASLHAALTVGEVTELARATGIASATVTMTSDRHWTLSFTKA